MIIAKCIISDRNCNCLPGKEGQCLPGKEGQCLPGKEGQCLPGKEGQCLPFYDTLVLSQYFKQHMILFIYFVLSVPFVKKFNLRRCGAGATKPL